MGEPFQHAVRVERPPAVNGQGKRFPQCLLDGMLQECCSLVQVNHLPPVVGNAVVADPFPMPINLARLEWIEQGQASQQERLSRARGPGNHEAIAGRERKRHVLDEPPLSIGMAAAEVAGFEHDRIDVADERLAQDGSEVWPLARGRQVAVVEARGTRSISPLVMGVWRNSSRRGCRRITAFWPTPHCLGRLVLPPTACDNPQMCPVSGADCQTC